MKIRTSIVIFLLVVSLIPGSGCIDSSSEPVKETKLDEGTDNQDVSSIDTAETSPPENFSDRSNALELEKQRAFSGYYSKENLQFEADVPAYSLPLKASELENFYHFTQQISLTNENRNLLYKNGFVVIENEVTKDRFKAEQVNATYRSLKVAGVPIFITTDSLLHLYHIQFDETLKRVEEEEFYDKLWELDKAFLEASIENYNEAKENNSSSEEVTEAARRNVAYFAVALSLLEEKPDPNRTEVKSTEEQGSEEYSFEVPSFVKEEVETELALIEAHEGFARSPIFLYEEDYSQYVPRGHYTSSEKLMNYFRAMMWHGRISMLLRSDLITAEEQTIEGSATEDSTAEESALEVSEKKAKIQTIQALLISDHFDRDESLRARWDRIYDVTAFYVGFSDDLGPYEYARALDAVFGGNRERVSFDNENLTALKTELEKYENPKIYGGTGKIIPAGPDTENETLDATKGFRFMGQRYVPDSYILQVLHPPALNIMYLLGSERAREHLINLNISESEGYKVRYRSLENEFGALDEEAWNKNLYWAQLYALKPLLVSYPAGYPTFMQTEAWEDKQLNTALASWTELRHDTILYAKQAYFTGAPYVPPEEKPVQGYVEPAPEFYARMLALTRMAHAGLADMKVLDEQSDKDFTTLETTLEKLLEISIKELENKELTDEEYEFIRNFDQNIAPMLEDIDGDAQSSVMVADVYTNLGSVLEEGTGKLDLMVVAYKQPDGRIVLGAGPVMSYYEFWQPSGERLTDEEWREMLENDPPERPEWISSFRG
ncbi:DUF3160 domain-containing protein [Methanosarcina acetivorans]|uniref:DUF3160 domain-containing protein n=1 Tax=Methanosarcina acetivorans TaxID=2214 RepID=UPI00064EABEB|nr:DUF3160 domain-containing protein [Methanosarcina acetivorans]